MEYYSRTKKPVTIPAPKCEKIIPTFSLEINAKTGKKELKQTGKTNIYDKIQASKDQTLIYNILERFNAGDTTVLNKMQGTYGDFTNVPKTLAEAQQQLINAENIFMSMPLEIRKEFNHSTSEFLAAAANGDLQPRLSKFVKMQPKVEEKETQVQKPVENFQPLTNGGNQQ